MARLLISSARSLLILDVPKPVVIARLRGISQKRESAFETITLLRLVRAEPQQGVDKRPPRYYDEAFLVVQDIKTFDFLNLSHIPTKMCVEQ